jgi:hypothetical protein
VSNKGGAALPMINRYIVGMLTAAMFFAQSFAPAARASDTKRQLTMQLNNLQPMANACRMTFMITNRLGTEIRDASFEIVLFDKSQAVARLLALNPGRLPDGKTRVKQFDIKGFACGNIARVLLNDVKRCVGEALTPAVCLDAARPNSRLAIPFIN